MANPTEASPAAAPPSVPLPGHGPLPGHRPPPGKILGPLPESPVVGTSAAGAGVLGQSNLGPGVRGESVLSNVAGSSASDGVFGEGGNGVHGVSVAATGAGVLGEHRVGGQGVLGSSVSGVGVEARSQTGTGVFGQGWVNGVQGTTANSSASGVWGENTGGGFGVSGSTTSSSAGAGPAGVWGNNSGDGAGVKATSSHGPGILASGTPAGHFEGDVELTGTLTQVGNGAINGNIIRANDLSAAGSLTVSGPASFGSNLTMGSLGDIILSDCAEYFEVANAGVEPGMVMVIDDAGNLCPCEQAYDKRVAGVVSGAGQFRPAILLGQNPRIKDCTPVALVGKVFCKVDAELSPIDIGDLLTTSPTVGHAMKAVDRETAFGAIIGKALGRLAIGRGMLPILVALQ